MPIALHISDDAYCPCGSGNLFAHCHGKSSSDLGDPIGQQASVIDAVTFFKETEILQLRLELLWDVVDKFVIVEADRTHRGEPKPLLLPSLAETTLSRYRSKIVFHPVSFDMSGLDIDAKLDKFDPRSAHWRLENAQRNGIDRACAPFSPLDVLIISDVDEIPDPHALKTIFSERKLLENLPLSLHQHLFYYSLKYLRNDYWLGSVLTTVGRSRASSANWHRAHRELFPVYGEPAGWHLSYFGGRESIRRKLGSFAHQELNNPAINSDGHIERCLASGTDLYGRAVDTTLVSDAFFPAHFVKLVNRHKEFFW